VLGDGTPVPLVASLGATGGGGADASVGGVILMVAVEAVPDSVS
jgi:hypothetical protein